MPRNVRNESNGPETAADGVLQVAEPLRQRAVRAHDGRPAHTVGMTVQILRGRMHDDIEAVLERPLHEGRGERVVANADQSFGARNRRHGRQIDQLQQWIAGRLHPDEARVGTDRGLQRLGPCQIDERDLVSRGALANVLEQPVSAAVEIVHRDDMRAGIEQLEHGRAARHPARERECRATALQVAERGLQRIARRVAGARVVVPLVHARARLHVGRGGVDRRHHGARQRIGMLPPVNGAGGEAHLLVGHQALMFGDAAS